MAFDASSSPARGWTIGRTLADGHARIAIDLANLVYRPDMTPEGEPALHGSNAKGKLEAYLQTKVPGPQNDELRKAVRASWDLANKVTHGSIRRHHAFAAAQATVMLVRTVAAIEAEVS